MQGFLIAALLLQLRLRRVAESESRKRLGEMTHMNRRVALGEMSASIAHELNQPLGAILNNAGAAELLLKADPPRLRDLAEILADIKRDDQRASDIVAGVRRMLVKADVRRFDPIDLNATIEEALSLLAEDAAMKGVTLESELEPRLPPVQRGSDRREAGHRQPGAQCHGGHGRPADGGAAPADPQPPPNGKEAAVSVGDSGPRHSFRAAAAHLRGLHHVQEVRHGARARHLAHDRRNPWRQNAGRERAGRRRDHLLHPAARCRASRMKPDPATVHVVDDDESWRRSVARLLGAAGYLTELYESAEAFIAADQADAPGCILLDVRMPGLSGLQLQQRLAGGQRPLPIIFLSGHADIPLTVRAVKAGAQDLLTKPVGTEVLLEAVAQAVARDVERRGQRAHLDDRQARIRSLTPSERKVFDLVVRGRLNKQIAAELGITERTVKWHRHNMMPKLNVGSLAGLVSLAEQLGMIGAQEGAGPGPD